MSKVAALNVHVQPRLPAVAAAPATSSKGEDGGKGGQGKAIPAPSTPAAPAPASNPAPLSSSVLNVLIDVQAGLKDFADHAEAALGSVIDRLEGHDHDHGHGHGAPDPTPAPPTPAPTPAPQPVRVAPGDTAAATLTAAQIVNRLSDETEMGAALATLMAGRAQQRAAVQEAGDQAGIAILKTLQSEYAAWNSVSAPRAAHDLAA